MPLGARQARHNKQVANNPLFWPPYCPSSVPVAAWDQAWSPWRVCHTLPPASRRPETEKGPLACGRLAVVRLDDPHEAAVEFLGIGGVQELVRPVRVGVGTE